MKVLTDAGATIEIGATETTPTIGITDYSRRTTDDFGVTTVVPRGFSRRLSVRALVAFDAVDALQRALANLRATAATWVADDRFAWLSVRGFYKDFTVDLATPPVSWCTLTVEGLAETESGADPGGDPATDGASTLTMIDPVAVTDAVLIASSIAEDDYPEWAASVAYPVGAHIIRASTHRIYEAVVASTGIDPAPGATAWLDIGPVNRWAMFDQALGTTTSAPNRIAVTLDPGTAGALALLDVAADTVRVESTEYDRTIVAGEGAITFIDLPATGQVTVTVARAGGTVSIGTLLIGRLMPLGVTEASASAGITDFSRKQADDFGEVSVVERAWAKRMTAKALIRVDAVDIVANRIAAVRARPVLWIGQRGLDSLTVYGFFKDFSIEVGETTAKLSLTIEGLSRAAPLAPLTVAWPDIGDPTGTKPDDNADVTADHTAKDTQAVQGRPAGDVLTGIDTNIDGILAQALRQDDLVQVFDARTLVEGQPVGTRFLAFRNQASDPVTGFASASDFAGVFTKAANGTGYTMNLQSVKAGNATFADVLSSYDRNISDLGQASANLNRGLDNLSGSVGTLSRNLQTTAAEAGDAKASVDLLQQAFASPDGQGFAKALLRVDVNGTIGGLTVTNDGHTVDFDIFTQRLTLRDQVSGAKVVLAQYVSADQRWRFPGIEAALIEQSAVSSAMFLSVAQDVNCAYNGTTTVIDLPFTTQASYSMVELLFFGRFWSGDDLQFEVTMSVDGVSYPAGEYNIVLDGQASLGKCTLTPVAAIGGLAPGNHSLQLLVTNHEPDGGPLKVKAGSFLKVTEYKKGAL